MGGWVGGWGSYLSQWVGGWVGGASYLSQALEGVFSASGDPLVLTGQVAQVVDEEGDRFFLWVGRWVGGWVGG